MPNVQRWTGLVAAFDGGGFVSYGDYLTLKEQLATVTAERDELKADATRLDYIEQLAESSRSGVTIDYAKYVEDGRVLERGYRISWFHHLGDREKTLRKAIDTAIANGEKT